MALYEMLSNAVDGDVSVQKSVRKMLADDCSVDHLAVEVGDFKDAMSLKIDDIPDKSDRKVINKKVNNIINDVSRICKEVTGYGIRATNRVAPYVYEAFEVPHTSYGSDHYSGSETSDSEASALATGTASPKVFWDSESATGALTEMIKDLGADVVGEIIIPLLRDAD